MYLYGVEIPQQDIDKGYISYRTLCKMFDAILCNNISQNEKFRQNMWDELYRFYESQVKEMSPEDIQQECKEYEIDVDSIDQKKQYLIDEKISEFEVFQYFIVDSSARNIIEAFTDDLVVYYEELDVDVWCITHFGTSWEIVYTDYLISQFDERIKKVLDRNWNRYD